MARAKSAGPPTSPKKSIAHSPSSPRKSARGPLSPESPRAAVPKAETDNGNSIHVCVRLRPFNAREEGETLCVDMPNDQEVRLYCKETAEPLSFVYDHAYWSHNDEPGKYFCSQDTIMKELGEEVLQNAHNGYNGCLFAYGQTGSGKTFSVLGNEEPPNLRGLLPRIIEKFFKDISKCGPDVKYVCKASYLEIYNENLRDLLKPPTDNSKQGSVKLDVRTHPKLGTIIPGLSENFVGKYSEVKKLIDYGAKARSVASTNMNAGSSRSHCIFTFDYQKTVSTEGKRSELRAKINLVDLAGSERVKKSGVSGDRLKEGACINQSLSALAHVINSLADECDRRAHGKPVKSNKFVPFRNSKLTQILEESLSGNSKTLMMAAISPALSNYEETLSTLRFAATCKKVTTSAKKNEESKETLLADMQAEIKRLKEQLAQGVNTDELAALLEANEYGYSQLSKTPQEIIKESKRMEEMRLKALEDMGLSMDEIAGSFKVDKDTPHLLNISEDPALSGSLVYFLPLDEATSLGSGKDCKIVLKALGIKPYICQFANDGHRRVTLTMLDSKGREVRHTRAHSPKRKAAASRPATGQAAARQSIVRRSVSRNSISNQHEEEELGRVLVNGKRCETSRQLKHLDRLILGHASCFRVMIPALASSSQVDMEADIGLDDVLGEVVRDDSPEYNAMMDMINNIQDRLGIADTQEFINVFKSSFPLIEEGNMITREVRPLDGFRFQMEVCTDVLTFNTDMPELIIRLYKRRVAGKGDEVVDIYELVDYVQRLQTMREIYSKFKEDPEETKNSMLGPGRDPWLSYTYHDIQDLTKAKDQEIRELEDLIRSCPGGCVKLQQLYASRTAEASPPLSPSGASGWESLWDVSKDDGKRRWNYVKYVMPYSTRARGDPERHLQRNVLRGFHV